MDESLFLADLTSWEKKCRRERNPLYLKYFKDWFWHHYKGLIFGVQVYTGVFYWYLNLEQESERSFNLPSVEVKPFPQGCSPVPRSSGAWAWGSFQFSQLFSKAVFNTAYKRSTWKSHADRGEVLLNVRDLVSAPDLISLFAVLPLKGKSSPLLAACSILAFLLKHLYERDPRPQYQCTISASRFWMGWQQTQSSPNVVAVMFLPTTHIWREHSALSRTIS